MSVATLEQKSRTQNSSKAKLKSPPQPQTKHTVTKDRPHTSGRRPAVRATTRVPKRGPKRYAQPNAERVSRARRTTPPRAAVRQAGHRALQPVNQPHLDPPFTLEKAFVYFSYVVALALVTAFGVDLLLAVPFLGASMPFDIANVLGGVTLAYLSWNTHRDLA